MKIPEVIVVKSAHDAGSLAKILTLIGSKGIVVEGLKATRRSHSGSTWEITLEPEQGTDIDGLVAAIDKLSVATVVGRSDRVFDRHVGGKIKMVSRIAITSDELLRDLYTPGVSRVSMAIKEDPSLLRKYTYRSNAVAIVTNGSAILGLGNIGAQAGLPVIEGKAALFAELVGLSGIPILIESQDPEVIIETVMRIAPSFGAIQLEDIGAPECFEIENRLKSALDIPVMHDDQHGTGVVTLAALINATARVGIDLKECTVGQIGLGAAGLGICRLLRCYDVKRLIGADLDPAAISRLESMGGQGVSLESLMKDADVVVATTGVKGLIQPEWVRKGQVVLALSNPEPEIEPEIALERGAAFAADGKVVNNVLGFPGLFLGALRAGTKQISDTMMIAAAESIAKQAEVGSLVPHPLVRAVHEEVAAAVEVAARKIISE